MTKLCNSCEYLKYCARSGIEEVGCDRYKRDTTTNEEWFCGLSTEEKAKWMAKHMSFCEVCEIVTCRGDGCQRFDRGSMTETDAFREWLKQPHKGSDTE